MFIVLLISLSSLTGFLSILKIFMPITKVLTFISGTGFMISLSVLGLKHNLIDYCKSIEPTLYLHENLKIHAKASDYRKDSQILSYPEKNYNSCVFNSYISLSKNKIKVVITVPKNGEAQDLLNKKLLNLRKDLIFRFPEYSFGGKFEQFGGFKVLQGNLN